MSAACLAAALGTLRVREVLDVGCGVGQFTRLLAAHLPAPRSIVGIDPDKDSIDEARRRTDDRTITFRLLRGDETPYAAARFDLVAVANALHHLEDPAAVLREMRRVAKDDGWLVVEELVNDGLNPAEENGRSLHHLKAAIDRAKGRSHRPTYSREEIRSIVLEADARIDYECEIVDEKPAGPGSQEVDEALGFLGEYVQFARDLPGYDRFQQESARIARELHRSGIATPPMLLIRARFLPRS